MRVIVQRVTKARCLVDNKVTGQIEHGLMLLIGFTHQDSINNVKVACKKIANLRIFDDENGKMNKSILDVKGEILAISQFTLYADTKKGNRPSFIDSMAPDEAKALYLQMVKIFQDEYQIKTEIGCFGAHMILEPICSGPVTISLEI